MPAPIIRKSTTQKPSNSLAPPLSSSMQQHTVGSNTYDDGLLNTSKALSRSGTSASTYSLRRGLRPRRQPTIVIIGGGVIGVCIAYYLATLPNPKYNGGNYFTSEDDSGVYADKVESATAATHMEEYIKKIDSSSSLSGNQKQQVHKIIKEIHDATTTAATTTTTTTTNSLNGDIENGATAETDDIGSQQPSTTGPRIILLERVKIACSASGKAGGFLACEWSEGTDIDPLVRKSFELHEDLANELDGAKRWEYRKVNTFILQLNMEGASMGSEIEINDREPLSWIRRDIVEGIDQMGATDNTAQVSPLEFTQALFEEAQKRGNVEFKIGTARDVQFNMTETLPNDNSGHIPKYSIVLEGEDKRLLADKVVVACGAWSGECQEWQVFARSQPQISVPILGQRAHSIILKPRRTDLPPQCLFLEIKDTPYDGEDAIEIYPRTNGTVYVCGEALDPDQTPPKDPLDSIAKPGACERLRDIVLRTSDDLVDSQVLKEQACYLPVSKAGIPIIGEVPNIHGIYIATGHSCWGILNGPATGLAMAELILFGSSKCIDLHPFRVGRFDIH
ncbi:hypothetical protein H4219_004621 [Mycoemilia scoparia]|uniref:FAD dependent oxidoreductase domain-containing protein n=1 Tax=Mycoemilia scoparia TaxID=417184 RepID=A0A9W7ZR33_9FUNG|nr:hypothetical protein H4219_004621 [Mycoemilia scoparia]